MNWKNEAIERLTKYTAMVQAVENIPKEISRLEHDAREIHGFKPDRVSRIKNSGPRDDYMIGNIIKRQELGASLENAKIWVEITDQALSVLSDEERNILEKMYVVPQRGVVSLLCSELGVEQSSVYRKRDQALYRFTMALYGAA